MEQPEYEEHQDSEEAKKFIPSTEIEVGLTSESSSSYCHCGSVRFFSHRKIILEFLSLVGVGGCPANSILANSGFHQNFDLDFDLVLELTIS